MNLENAQDPSFFSEFIAFANQFPLHNVYIKRPNVADFQDKKIIKDSKVYFNLNSRSVRSGGFEIILLPTKQTIIFVKTRTTSSHSS